MKICGSSWRMDRCGRWLAPTTSIRWWDQDRQEFNDKKLAVNLAALCDTSVGAVNRHPDINVREFIDRLCGGDGEGISPDRLSEVLRTLDQLNGRGS
jgi:hypothetical protein